MIQVTLLSAHEGQMRNDKYFYLTLLGGCSLTRPTFARQLLARRQRESMGSTSARRPFFLTILGGVEIDIRYDRPLAEGAFQVPLVRPICSDKGQTSELIAIQES